MGNMNKVTITNTSKFNLEAEFISHSARFPISLPYNKPVEFEVGTYHDKNVIRINHVNGEQFGVTYFSANSGDNDVVKITDHEVLFNNKPRFEKWDKAAVEKYLSG